MIFVNENLVKRRLFRTYENSYFMLVPPCFTKDWSRNYKQNQHFQTCHFMFCKRYWYHMSKHPFMPFDRYWSHIHDLGDFIRRIFIISRCPSFSKLTKCWKSRFTNIFVVKHVSRLSYISCHFLGLLWSICLSNRFKSSGSSFWSVLV